MMDRDWRVNLYRSNTEQRRDVWADPDMEFADLLTEICDENSITDTKVMKILGQASGDVILGAAHPDNVLRVFTEVGIEDPERWSDRAVSMIEEKLGSEIWNQTDALINEFEPRLSNQ